MVQLRALALAGAVMLMASFSAGLAAQDAGTAAASCPSGGGAAASPSASPAASPTATTVASPEASPQASPTAATCTIEIRDLAYEPAQTDIAVGTTVTWTNSDTVPHSATATDGAFDSGIFDPGESFSYTFDEAGTFDYTCLVHPEMKGTIVVR